MIQISCDGLNVNLSFLDMIKDNLLTEKLPNLIDLVSYGLHTAHNTFKYGEYTSGWLLTKILSIIVQDL